MIFFQQDKHTFSLMMVHWSLFSNGLKGGVALKGGLALILYSSNIKCLPQKEIKANKKDNI